MQRLVALAAILVAVLPIAGPRLRAENQALIIEAYSPDNDTDPKYNCFWNDSYCMFEMVDTNFYVGPNGRHFTMPLGKIRLSEFTCSGAMARTTCPELGAIARRTNTTVVVSPSLTLRLTLTTSVR